MALSEPEQQALDEAAVFCAGQDPTLAARLGRGVGGDARSPGADSPARNFSPIMVSLLLAVGLVALGLPAQAGDGEVRRARVRGAPPPRRRALGSQVKSGPRDSVDVSGRPWLSRPQGVAAATGEGVGIATSRPSGEGEKDRAEALAAAEHRVDEVYRRRAVLAVAHHATDVEDCLELLDMLGLGDLLELRRG